MTRIGRSIAALAACACGLIGSACAGREAEYAFIDNPKRGAGTGVHVQWARELARDSTAYVPVETAPPGLDPLAGRIYAGSSRGTLFAMNTFGRSLYHYTADSAIEAQPVLDPARGEIYVATVRGSLLAMRSQDFGLRWRTELGSSVTQPPLLSSDAAYVATDGDAVIALSRTDGAILWRYRREVREGFVIAGHAGLTLAGNKLLTGFGDGTVVALDASDGRLLWSVDTSADIEDDSGRTFYDVDTTPIVIGDTVYVASFAAGLFGLELSGGTLRFHEGAFKGVTAIAASQDALVISSAEQGVICLDLLQLTLRWRHKIDRGAPGRAQLSGDAVYVPESMGALLSLALADGKEIGRLETGHGITASPVLEGRRGFVLSNSGVLYAFTF